MKASTKTTLIATLVGTAAGTLAWTFGVAQLIWRAHPVLADCLITVIAYVIAKQVWSAGASKG